jgi:hypothetical protein
MYRDVDEAAALTGHMLDSLARSSRVCCSIKIGGDTGPKLQPVDEIPLTFATV